MVITPWWSGWTAREPSMRAVEHAAWIAATSHAKPLITTAYVHHGDEVPLHLSEQARVEDLLKDEGWQVHGDAPIRTRFCMMPANGPRRPGPKTSNCGPSSAARSTCWWLWPSRYRCRPTGRRQPGKDHTLRAAALLDLSSASAHPPRQDRRPRRAHQGLTLLVTRCWPSRSVSCCGSRGVRSPRTGRRSPVALSACARRQSPAAVSSVEVPVAERCPAQRRALPELRCPWPAPTVGLHPLRGWRCDPAVDRTVYGSERAEAVVAVAHRSELDARCGGRCASLSSNPTRLRRE